MGHQSTKDSDLSREGKQQGSPTMCLAYLLERIRGTQWSSLLELLETGVGVGGGARQREPAGQRPGDQKPSASAEAEEKLTSQG